MAYALKAHRRIAKDLAATPPRIAEALRQALDALADEPDGAFDLKPLQAERSPRILRLRIGTYRILLTIDHEQEEIVVLRLGPRKSVYRRLGDL